MFVMYILTDFKFLIYMGGKKCILLHFTYQNKTKTKKKSICLALPHKFSENKTQTCLPSRQSGVSM